MEPLTRRKLIDSLQAAQDTAAVKFNFCLLHEDDFAALNPTHPRLFLAGLGVTVIPTPDQSRLPVERGRFAVLYDAALDDADISKECTDFMSNLRAIYA